MYLAANNPNKVTEVIQQSYLKSSEHEKWFKLQGEYNSGVCYVTNVAAVGIILTLEEKMSS